MEEELDYALDYNKLTKTELKFRPKKMQAYTKDMKQKSCDICQIAFDRERNFQEIGAVTISCYGCSQSCHLYCYGLQTKIEMEVTKDQGYFACDRCNVNSKQDYACYVCQQKSGLKKLIENTKDEFVHPICGLFSKALEVTSFYSLSFRKSQQPPSQIKCCICNSKGAYTRCCDDSCDKNAHMYCILQGINDIGGITLNYSEVESNSKVWNIKYRYQQLFTRAQLNGSIHEIKNSIKTQAKSTMKQFFTIQQTTIDIDVDALFDAYSSIEQMEEERQSVLAIYCSDHKKEDNFCSCQMITQQQDQMIQCDTCSEWYHQDCLPDHEPQNFADIADQEHYLCQFCRQLNQTKQSKILKLQLVQDLSHLLPNYYNINIQTLILLGIYCERSIQKLLKNYDELAMRTTESLLANLPFFQALQTQVSKLKEKSHLQDFLNYVLRNCQYRSDTWIVKSQLNADFTPCNANIQSNNKLKQKISKVQALFGGTQEQFFQNLEMELNLIQQVFELITNKQKMTIDQQLFFRQLNGYNEFEWFKAQDQAYRQFVQKLFHKFQDKQILFDEQYEIIEGEDCWFYLKEKSQFDELTYDNFKLAQNKTKIWLNQQKIPAQEMIEIINQAQGLPFDVRWLQELHDLIIETSQIIQSTDLKQKYGDIDETNIYLSRIENELFYYRDETQVFEFDASIQLFDERIEDLKQLVENETSDSELQQQKERPYSQKFSLEQLQELLKQAKQYEAPQNYFSFINQGIQLINETRDKITSMLQQKNMNDHDRKAFQSEIKLINQFDLPELTLLQKRIETFEKVEKVKSSKQSTLEQVKQALQLCLENSFDEKIQIALQNEIEKAQIIQQKIQTLLNHEIFGQEELDDAKEILQLINQSRVIIEEKEQVQSIQKGINFINELYDFYLEFKSPDQEMEIENDKKVDLQYQMNQIKDPQNILFKESERFVSELERILKKKIILLDQRIQTIYKQYTDKLYQELSAKLVNDWKAGLEIEYKLIEKLFGCEIIKDFVQTYQEDQQKMLILLQQMNQLVHIKNSQLVSEWIDNYNIIAVRVKGGKWDELKLAFFWIQVIQKYIETTESKQCTYESLRLIQDLMNQTNFPRKSGLYQELDGKIIRFQNLIQKLREYNQQRELYFDKSEQKRFKQQYQYTAALQLQKWLNNENINYDFIATDFNEDIRKVQEVQIKFYGDMKEENSDVQLYKTLRECFIADLTTHDQLKTRIYLQKIRDNNNGVINFTFSKARKLLNMIYYLMKSNPINDKEDIERFAQNVQIADKINNLSQRLHDVTSYSFEELEQCYEQMEFIKNIEVDNSSNIELLYDECRLCKQEVDQIIKKSIKEDELTIQNLIERVRKLPLLKEYSLLMSWWENYQLLKQKFQFTRTELTRQKANPNSKELTQLMNQLIQLNDQCMIQNIDSEILLKNYQEQQEKLEYIENNLNDDNISEEFNQIPPMFRWGDQYFRVRNLIWIKQVNNFKENPQNKWSIRQLKNVMHQGYDILDLQGTQKSQIEKLRQPMNYLESLMSKCIEHVMSQDSEQYVENKINVLELQLEIKDVTNSSQRAQLIKEFQPKRPFEDLQTYFSQKNKLKLNQKPEEKLQKHKEQQKKVLSKVDDQVRKKTKAEDPQVNQPLRDAKRKDLYDALKQNKYFNNYKKDPSILDKTSKILENQEFGEFLNKKQLYVEKINKLVAFLKELSNYEHLSQKLLAKQFSQESISVLLRKYDNNQLQNQEEQIKQKIQQKHSAHYNPLAIKQTSSLLKPTQVIQQPQKKNSDIQSKQKQTTSSSKNLLDMILEDDGMNKPIQPQFIQPIQQKPQVQQVQIKTQPVVQKSKSPSPKSIRKRSDSSDLPEYQHKISHAINYNPDENQEPIPKTQTVRQLQELTYADDIYKLGKKFKLKIDKEKDKDRHNSDKEKVIVVEWFTQVSPDKLQHIHNLSSLEIKLQSNQAGKDLRSIEEFYTQKEKSSIISGWAFPEKYSDLGEINRYAEYLKKHQLSQSYKHEHELIYFFHIEQIRESVLFKQLTIPEIVTEGHLQKKDAGIYKYWGNAFTKLAFVILIKNTNSSSLSNVSIMPKERQRNIIGSDQVKNFIDKVKKDQLLKQQQLQQQQEQSQQQELQQQILQNQTSQQYEPVTSEEENGDNLELLLNMPDVLGELYKS
ncbi:hypothetical protein pb186bvf_008937 [Paramecium bursaria]